MRNEKGITTFPVYSPVKGVDNIVELHNAEMQTEELSMHGLTELVDDVVALSAASGIPVVTGSGEAPPPADDGRRAETQLAEGSFPKVHELLEEFEVIDDDVQNMIDNHILVQEDIIVQDSIMDPDVEAFIGNLMEETDVICILCDGSGKAYFGDHCPLCDGLVKIIE